MSKKRRFYQLAYANTGEPVAWEDLGNTLKMTGVLLEGMGSQMLIVSPSGILPEPWDDYSEYDEHREPEDEINLYALKVVQPSLEEWSEILRQSDDPVYFAEDETGVRHIHRKQRMAISGAVQQKIFVRDGLQCVFCLRKMGEVQITVDHFIPLEQGGKNIEHNYISCCRRCNKDKGNIDAREYCDRVGVSYANVIGYMALGHTNLEGIRYWDTPDSIRKK